MPPLQPAVHYYLTSLQHAPHETRAIDIRQLRDAQVADFKGNRIRASATDGSVNWIRADNVPVTGRLLVTSRRRGLCALRPARGTEHKKLPRPNLSGG